MSYVERDRIQYHGSHFLVIITFVSVLLSWFGQISYSVKQAIASFSCSVAQGSQIGLAQLSCPSLSIQLWLFNIIFGLLALALLGFYLKRKKSGSATNFTLVYLTSTFAILIALRLSFVAQMTYSVLGYMVAFFACILNFLVTAKRDLRESAQDNNHHIRHSSRYEWQLLFIRIFIGFDLVPHFCEKLFSGNLVRMEDVHSFSQLGVPHPLFFVFVAGIIEFLGAFALGCGFLTRLGALCLVIYLLVATYLGHHFSIGFIWALPGGGWEYPILWASLIFSFIFFGGGGLSIDRALRDRYSMPRWILFLMGSRHF